MTVMDKGRQENRPLVSGNPGSSVVNAVGSLIYGFDASMIDAIAEATVNQLLK